MNDTNQHKPATIQFDPNVSAALSYLIPPLTGIIFFILEKENKFVKFHALQSALLGVIGFFIFKIIALLKLFLIGFLLDPLISVVALAVVLFCMFKAYNNIEYSLPYIGDIAKKHVYK